MQWSRAYICEKRFKIKIRFLNSILNNKGIKLIELNNVIIKFDEIKPENIKHFVFQANVSDYSQKISFI